MKLTICESNDLSTPNNNKYILYFNKDTQEFNNYDDAVRAYNNCNGCAKFLYQPDKRYFLITLSSTGFNYGKRNTVKAYGLFIAKNINQIRKFLANDVKWQVFGGYRSEYSKFRIYTGGYGSAPVCSDTDWEKFNFMVKRELTSFGKSYDLKKDFGALDVNSASNDILMHIPFETF